ncbi:MAG: sporulation protein YqfD [Bacillota bacterium]|nr:sporulation protein YqfD [Bacillota bacterium]
MIRGAKDRLQASIRIEIRGDGQRFLHAAAREGLPLRRVRREGPLLLAELRVKDAQKLRRALRLSRCSMRIRRRQGLPFLLAFWRRRPLLLLLPILLTLGFCLLSACIFRVEVSSPEPLPAGDYQRVLQTARENGLFPGRFLWQVDQEHCQRQISLEFPELFFVEISRRGVCMEIRIAKRISLSPAQQPRAPGDLVASCDAVIQDVLVRRGTAAVRSGDTVLKGQVLIYGWQGQEGAVAADGIVTGRVWASAYAECPTRLQKLEPSGRQRSLLQLRGEKGALLTLLGDPQAFPRGELHLQSRPLPTWRNLFPTVELLYGTVDEFCPREYSYSYAQARKIAEREAELSARARLAAACDISSTSIRHRWVEELQLEEDLARVQVRLEAESQIGLYVENLREEPPLPEVLPPKEES